MTTTSSTSWARPRSTRTARWTWPAPFRSWGCPRKTTAERRGAAPDRPPGAGARQWVRDDEEARGRAACLPWCELVEVVVDAVPVEDPGLFFRLGVTDYESVEYLTGLQAGVRWGLRTSAAGALVIYTRGRGPAPGAHAESLTPIPGSGTPRHAATTLAARVASP